MSIKVDAVSKFYGHQKAVDQISFQIEPGEIVGFLGPNGAGKSTTMKMITGYLSPDEGNIEICGMAVAKESHSAKSKIGYLPESNPLYYDMYVGEFLEFIAGIHGLKNKKSTIEKYIELTGLPREKNKKLGQLSKGYKQRAGLAAALLHDPEVLVLDEPTTGLDPNQILEIREVIRKLGEKKSILFSSHILQEVQALCKRVIIINKGRIVADGPLENMLAGKQTKWVSVRFREIISAGQLRQLDGAKQIVNRDLYEWVIETETPEQINHELLKMALNQSLNIVSLQTETQNLEEVFRNLTN